MFAVAGGLIVLRWRWVAWLHLPALAWSVGIELIGGICPLTDLEDRLRGAGEGASHSADFIDRGLSALLYPASLTRADQIGLGVGLLLLNALVYALALRRVRATQ